MRFGISELLIVTTFVALWAGIGRFLYSLGYGDGWWMLISAELSFGLASAATGIAVGWLWSFQDWLERR